MADAIVAIARAMGVKLIAEGIETEQQLDYLKRAGCGEGQGYYFSRPVDEAGARKRCCAGSGREKRRAVRWLRLREA
jgi:EAL domain-containing protein (putative c-di-GMP-specific phosphodiesterase class I)